MEKIEMDMGLSDVRGSVQVGESSVGKGNGDRSKKRRREDNCDSNSDCPSVVKRPVVVLTKLPDYKIRALRPPTPTQFYSEDECQSTSESDGQWEPDNDSTGSDFSDTRNKQNKGKSTKSLQKKTAAQNNTEIVPEPAPIIISTAFALCADETRSSPPDLPEQEVTVGMTVLAKKKHMMWKKGKIVEMLSKEGGRLKYKVEFEEKGRSLVSGHHIAFTTTPKLEEMYVGARVVISCTENKSDFRPGILAELPSRKNRLRFLVFTDDHVPVYVGLPALHLVCRPLNNSLDDLPESPHKFFMTRYLRDWPCPHLTQYKCGMKTNIELNGVLQKCEVQVVDCSLIEVFFLEDKKKEWIYRGSTRLEHMVKILKLKEMEREKEKDSN
ncbi:histone-lysine N-methyltransferase SETDB1-B-like [Halichoeres trimaculatus]|uniref:histone-lysine N-methyltransferase SETDB1-B-like n=1 Tax=Halichoeres trimaculatus TaxID=147232 RepID=UPI003D9E84BE